MRRTLVVALIALSCAASAAPAHARAAWKVRLDEAIGSRSLSVRVAQNGRLIYRQRERWERTPASNQKLLLSMALLERFGAGDRIPTRVFGPAPQGGVVRGDLWIVGRGDPALTARNRYARKLRVRPTRIGGLVRDLADAGVTRIEGRVLGHTGPFAHDWWAPGWKEDFPDDEVPLATALSIDGNVYRSRHIREPERRAARVVTRRLERAGIRVTGTPGTGRFPGGGRELAEVTSAPLIRLLRHMNRLSSNFFAEVLGKRLGWARYGAPGSTAKGAAAIEAWTGGHGVPVTAYDSSGLSYSNRARPKGMARLVGLAEDEPWGSKLRKALPGGGQGTLKERLRDFDVRAKTGTLNYISTLSGWVKLEETGRWAEFSIMSSGMYKDTAAALEDQIVRAVARNAR